VHPNAQLIESFYTAFQRHDAEAMAACYHPGVTFSDPVFRDLRGDRARGMWRMLLARATSLEVTFRDVAADDQRGSAHWEAVYPFTATGRTVHNVIDASFRFRDGKIIEHVDRFDLRRWAGMALGLPGVLFGWAPPLQNGIRRKAVAQLDRFMQKGGG
jgi:ketosteroid isomerase-like protein